jgi:hypothetical protein
MTGFTYLPHLHFQVFVVTEINAWTDFDTLEVQDFDISTNRPYELKQVLEQKLTLTGSM